MSKRGSAFFRWVITLLLFALAVFYIYNNILTKEKKGYEVPLSPVVIGKAYRTDVSESLKLTGYVEAQAMIPVVPFVPGTITEYYGTPGEKVQENDILAKIDPKAYELQVQQAEAVYLAAEATFQRVSSLYNSGAATQQNYDEALAQVNAYKAQYELAKVQLDYATIKAPVSGTIIISNGAVGSIGTNTEPLFVIADLNALEINLSVPEKYYNLISENSSSLYAIIEGNEAKSYGKVKSIDPYVSPQSKTFGVKLQLEDNVSSFRPGMFVNIQLVYNTYENALVIDASTRNSDGSLYIYDQEEEKAKYVNIPIIATDGEHLVIDSSYEDVWFIVDGQGKVLDGQRVKVL
ncbi:MAG: efflux RND transporter periplasmic adaptor subunit [Sphaerochaetaceae bacterium]|nr:efflux RND transporter periplasmic adaptor subunit [Sphaerochaetaceae bacterium]